MYLTYLQVDLLLHLDELSVISKLRYKLIPVEEEVEPNKYYIWQHTPDFDPAKIEELANAHTSSLVNDNCIITYVRVTNQLSDLFCRNYVSSLCDISQ